MRELIVGTSGPAPLGAVEVPLTPGVVALYGRNGAGKSRLIQAVGRVLRGEQHGWLTNLVDDAELSAALLDAHDQWRHDRRIPDGDRVQVEGAPWHDPERDPLERVVGDLIAERWLLADTALPWADADDRRIPARQLIDEVVRNHRFVRHLNDSESLLELHVELGPHTPGLRSIIDVFWGRWAEFQVAAREETGTDDPTDEHWLELWNDWLRTFDASDFLTVFGPLLRYAQETWWADPEGGAWDLDDPGGFAESLRQLSSPGIQSVQLTGVLPTTSLGPAARHPRPHIFTDSDFADPSTLTPLTATAVTTWGSWESTRHGPAPDTSVIIDPVEPALIETVDGSPAVASWASDLVEHLTQDATRLFQDLLPDAPPLRCELSSPDRWFDSDALEWTAVDPTGARVTIDELSNAQRRVAMLAITLVLTAFTADFEDRLRSLTAIFLGEDGGAEDRAGVGAAAHRFSVRTRRSPGLGTPSVFLLDEPEAGLHSSAEMHLIEALHAYGKRNNVVVMMATHSRAALKHAEVTLIEVHRSAGGRTSTRVVEFPQHADAESLGVDRSDLLQLIDAILLVEGQHDATVIDELVGDELRRRRVQIVPLRGAANLKQVADLELIAATLDVPVLTVLDNTRSDAMSALWDDLEALAHTPYSGSDIDALIQEHLGPNRSDEENQAISLARALLARNRVDRFSIFGLSAVDVIVYLPVQRLVPGATSWEELRTMHQGHLASESKKRIKDFKKWLGIEHRADFSDDSLRIACAALDAPPDEFLEMVARLDTVLEAWRR